MTGPALRIEHPDDETLEIYVGDDLVASATHDEHGWSGMSAVEQTAVAVDRALREGQNGRTETAASNDRVRDDGPPASVYEDAAKALLISAGWDSAAVVRAADEWRWQQLVAEAVAKPGLRAIVESVWANRVPTADAYRAADAAYHKRLDQAKVLAGVLDRVRAIAFAEEVDVEALRAALAGVGELIAEVG